MVKQKKLLLRCNDDSVIIMAFVLDDGYTIHKKGTKEEIDAEIIRASKSFPQERMPIKSWEEIEDSDIPQDRTYRDAWITKKKKTVEHDMVKAKELHKKFLRIEREPLLEALDIKMSMAYNNPKKQAEIEEERQKLRDITDLPSIEKAKTIEDLKKIKIKKDIL